MLLTDIKTMLAETKLPSTYFSYPEKGAPPLPYIVWYLPQSNNFVADDLVYKPISALNIELYTDNKDFTTEATVETVLNNWHMVWQKSEAYLDTEHMYEVLYEMQIVIDEETNNNGE